MAGLDGGGGVGGACVGDRRVGVKDIEATGVSGGCGGDDDAGRLQ